MPEILNLCIIWCISVTSERQELNICMRAHTFRYRAYLYDKYNMEDVIGVSVNMHGKSSPRLNG